MTVLYIATGDGVAHITQQGEEWRARITLASSGVQCLALDPHHIGTLYAGSHGKGVFKSEDGGMHWEDVHLPHWDVFSLAVSPVDGTVYAGCEPSMLFRSTDGGQMWEELAALRIIPFPHSCPSFPSFGKSSGWIPDGSQVPGLPAQVCAIEDSSSCILARRQNACTTRTLSDSYNRTHEPDRCQSALIPRLH